MSPDWSAKAEPVPYSKLDDPQTLNLYAYVRNNPISGVDPDGHVPTIERRAGSCAGNVTWCLMVDGTTANANLAESQKSSADQTVELAQNGAPAQQHTVTVAHVKGRGGNPAGHEVISVDGREAVGLEQKKDSATAALLDKTTPGAVRTDPGQKVKDKAVIPVTDDQAKAIQGFLDQSVKNPPNYNLYHSNCAEFCVKALHAGGVNGPDNDVLPASVVQDLNGGPRQPDLGKYVMSTY